MKLTGFVTFSQIGFHRWPDAPLDTAYLRSPHRHVFKVRLDFEQTHTERDVEYHALQSHAIEWFATYQSTLIGDESCEVMATALLKWCELNYAGRWFKVEVSEDGENGATVETEAAA